jgi:hypothetical protein
VRAQPTESRRPAARPFADKTKHDEGRDAGGGELWDCLLNWKTEYVCDDHWKISVVPFTVS